MEEYIKISKDFSLTPGARYISDGKYSGQDFYETILKNRFSTIVVTDGKKLKVDLDGTHGYATSFLDEAFGRLSKDFGAQKVLLNIIFISNEEPYLIEEIKQYIDEASQDN